MATRCFGIIALANPFIEKKQEFFFGTYIGHHF
jgi:hypothetical protein